MIVVRMGPGAGWNFSAGPRDQRLWDEHAVFMDDLFDRGLIELAGPLADGSGALSVVRSDSVDEVRGWFEADPWTVHDVLPVREVVEWMIFLDGRTASNARAVRRGGCG
jgi:uncharacterized protein YciI